MSDITSKDIILLLGGALLGGITALFIEILLPERIRIWLTLKKKLLSKWLRNPAYSIGITTRLDCRKPLELDTAKRRLRELYNAYTPTTVGSEIRFSTNVENGQINTTLQLAYEEDKDHATLSVFSINLTVAARTRYREIRNRIDDLRAALSESEDILVKELSVFPAKRALYIEVDRLEEFSEWLENLEAQQITGKIRNANAEFSYYDKRLVVEDSLNSATITWLKNIVAHVG